MTKTQVEIREQTATAPEIRQHLAACDSDFVPRLSSRVDIDAYAAKLRQKARTFEAWSGRSLVGVLAAYFNTDTGTCFITNVSVVRAFSGQGIANTLLERCLAHCASEGIKLAALEVNRGSAAAVKLYRRNGFSQVAVDDDVLTLQRPIENSAGT